MRLTTALMPILIALATVLPGISPSSAQEYESNDHWMTMGQTKKGDVLSLDVNSIQTKPNAGNWQGFVYRVTDSVETRERIGFTGVCNRGRLVSEPEWRVEFTPQKRRGGVRAG